MAGFEAKQGKMAGFEAKWLYLRQNSGKIAVFEVNTLYTGVPHHTHRCTLPPLPIPGTP